MDTSNARRFINAYNEIDHGLRAQYNMKRSMSFSDLIRRVVSTNHIVRKYEDDLVDFGRLRNAIIHRSNDAYTIAEPHDEVVQKIEKIARLITTPPNALATICSESVLIVDDDVTLENVVRLMAKYSYTNIPVYAKGTLVGIANGQKILEGIGGELVKGRSLTQYLKETPVTESLKTDSPFNQYEVLPASATVDEVMDLYYKNRKLLAVLITKTGTTNEIPLGIITTTNVMQMNNILDNY